MTVKKWLKTPKGYVTLALISYLIIASIGSKTILGIENTMVAVLVSFAADYLCCTFMKRKSSKDSTVITSLIISLILSFTTSWLVVAGTAIVAILSKHFIVYKKKPVFNPAAFGLLFSLFFISQTGQSWWGAFGDLPAWMIVFLLIGGYLITNRITKFPQVFSFLLTYMVLLFVMGLYNMGNAADAFRPPFINATLFFGFFMLTDPPTSPAKSKSQIVFGMLTAAAGVLVYGMFGGLAYLYIGLVLGNLYQHLQKRFSPKSAAVSQKVDAQTRVGRAKQARAGR
ncbi:RnfABCDGE type electron transport complex subunit D [Neobacillus sp. SM06]|uniref:RnfABCDGE type electron transport complex subunit D n=1 Tax=Neobacillus sp. SM06 TaxID=3422492 RepID=UPI003D27B8A4